MHATLCLVFALLATVNAASSGASSKASTTLTKPSAPSAASKVSSISKASKISSSGSGLPATSCPPVTLSPLTAYPSVFGYCYEIYTPPGGIPYSADEYTVVQFSTSINVTTTVTLCVPGASSVPKISSGSGSKLPASSPSKATGSASKLSSIPTSSKPTSSTVKASLSSSSSKISSASSSSKPASSSAKISASSSSSKTSSASSSSKPASSTANASGSSSASKISSSASLSQPASSSTKASASSSFSRVSTVSSASLTSSGVTKISSSLSVSIPKSTLSSSKASKTTPTPPPYYGRSAKDKVKRQEAGDDSAAYTSLSMLPASCQTSFCSSLAAYPEPTYSVTYTYTTSVITSVAPARETCGPTDFCDASTNGAGPVCRPLPDLYKCDNPTLPGNDGGIIEPCTLGGCQGGCFLDASENSSSCVVNHRDNCFEVGGLYQSCSSDSDCGRGQRCLYDFCPRGLTCTDAEPDCANPASKRSLFRQKRRAAKP